MNPIKSFLKSQSWFRPFRFRWLDLQARLWGYPRWKDLIGSDWEAWLHQDRSSGPRVLVATSIGAHLAANTVESLLAVALAVRGARPEILLCDQALPACLGCDSTLYPDRDAFVRNGPKADLCTLCFRHAHRMYNELGILVRRYGEGLTTESVQRAERISREISFEAIGNYCWNGINVGEHALAGALRFFAKGEIADEPASEAILRQYLTASLLTAFSVDALFQANQYDCTVLNHGIYVPQGIIASVARKYGIRVVTWNPAYRKRCLIFSHHDTYHHTLLEEPVEVWENLDLTPQREARLMDYLDSRRTGSQDWIWFHREPDFDASRIVSEFGVDPKRPWIGLLTNVVWDAQLHYRANAFPSMMDWVAKTVRYFAARPDLQLLIRVHPAEVNGLLPSRQQVETELARIFGKLPDNVFLIPPESPVSTYTLTEKCDTVLIYGTKTGVELTSRGIPVIVAGEAWIRGKGLTLDAANEEEYIRLLDQLPQRERMSASDIRRGRKYAYHFFFRRMIEVDLLEPASGLPPYRIRIDGLDRLRDGRCQGLDTICRGILNGEPFVAEPEAVAAKSTG